MFLGAKYKNYNHVQNFSKIEVLFAIFKPAEKIKGDKKIECYKMYFIDVCCIAYRLDVLLLSDHLFIFIQIKTSEITYITYPHRHTYICRMNSEDYFLFNI